MKITFEGTSKEIADLVLAVQGQQKEPVLSAEDIAKQIAKPCKEKQEKIGNKQFAPGEVEEISPGIYAVH